MALYDYTLYDLIKRSAVTFSGLPAWFEADDQRKLTFAEVKVSVDKLAAGLQRTGVQKGDRIGVLGKNSLEYFLLFGAAGAIGAIILPINWRLSEEEVVFILKDGTPRLLFADPEYHPMVNSFKQQLVSVQDYYSLKSSGGEFKDFDSLYHTTSAIQPVDVKDQDCLAMLQTAAFDGHPRGALLTHRNFICASVHFNLLMHISPDDVHLNLMPLFHVGGLFMALMSFHAGALNVNMPKFDAAQAVKLIDRLKVTTLLDFSPILSAILEQHEKTGSEISSLQHVIGLDAPETIEKYQKLTGGTFYSIYGQTETSSIVTLGRYNDRPGSAGRTIALADVKLVDDNDRSVSPGAEGEIAVKGPMVFSGYWNLPAETANALRGGWHHTGDLGRFDEDGFLFYAGRKPEKELIKPGGENVYPAEVENVILEHPDVEMAVVIGVPDPKWIEGIKAICQIKAGKKITRSDLIAFVGERIARHKKPQYVEFVEDMPKLGDGSPDRKTVKERFGED